MSKGKEEVGRRMGGKGKWMGREGQMGEINIRERLKGGKWRDRGMMWNGLREGGG